MLGAVRPAHRFDVDRFTEYVRTHLGTAARSVEVLQFDAGQSNPTYRVTVDGTPYVLRKKPPGKLLPKAHMVEREYRVMKALADTAVPVPEMLLLCEDAEVIGTPFFLMTYVSGRVFWDGRLPEQSPDERSALYAAMNQTLSSLHSIDIDEVGLSDFGRKGNYFARQISIWTRQYRASETETLPELDALMAWLPGHIPDDDSLSLVHGDYRLDNMIFHPTEPRVIALLDWELSTLGHPLADLAYTCMSFVLDTPYHPAVGPLSGPKSGLPTLEQTVAAYCQATGRDGIEDWDFYMAFSIFRSAAILQGVYKRGLQGNASSSTALSLGPLVQRAGRAAWAMVS